jgi:hypothetical protein
MVYKNQTALKAIRKSPPLKTTTGRGIGRSDKKGEPAGNHQSFE